MKFPAWHIIWIALAAFALGYWMPKLGDFWLGKIYMRKS